MIIVAPKDYIVFLKSKLPALNLKSIFFIKCSRLKNILLFDRIKKYSFPINIISAPNFYWYINSYMFYKSLIREQSFRTVRAENKNSCIYRGNYYQLLEKKNKKKLFNLNITKVIDLRANDDMVLKQKCCKCGIQYTRHSFYESETIVNYSGLLESVSLSYMGLLAQYKDIYNILIEIINSTGSILIFCKYGKDRTGVISMLLELLCNEDDESIILSYLVSFFYLKSLYWKTKPKDEVHYKNRYLLADNVTIFLKQFRDTYHSIYEYLILIGLSKEEIIKLTKKVRCLDE